MNGEDDDDDADSTGDVSPDILILVRSRLKKQIVVSTLGDDASVTHVNRKGGGTYFSPIGSYGRRVCFIATTESQNVEARMKKACSLARSKACATLVLIDPGYSVDDMRTKMTKKTGLPDACNALVVEDVELLLDVLGITQQLDAQQRQTLSRVFEDDDSGVKRVAAAAPPPPPPRLESPLSSELSSSSLSDSSGGDNYGEHIDANLRMAMQVHHHLNRLQNPIFLTSLDANDPIHLVATEHQRHREWNAQRRRSRGEIHDNDANQQRQAPPPPPLPLGMARANVAQLVQNRLLKRREEREARQAVQLAAIDNRAQQSMKLREEDTGIEAMTIQAADNVCMICMTNHVTTMTLPCLHFMFCFDCITQWTAKANKCPQCNASDVTLVQPRIRLNVQDEHRKRQRDPEHLESVARNLVDEAETLRKRAQTLREEDGDKKKKKKDGEEKDTS